MTSTLDTHEISTAALLRRAGLHRATLARHIALGFIPQGITKAGLRGRFWTISQANKYLRKIVMPDKTFLDS